MKVPHPHPALLLENGRPAPTPTLTPARMIKLPTVDAENMSASNEIRSADSQPVLNLARARRSVDPFEFLTVHSNFSGLPFRILTSGRPFSSSPSASTKKHCLAFVISTPQVEQARIMRLLVERVTITPEGIAVDLRTGGLGSVVRDMLTTPNASCVSVRWYR